MNNKADIMFITVIFLVSIVSFGVVSLYLINTSNTVSSELDDIACRSLIVGKADLRMKIGEFFFEINNKCIKEEIVEDYQNHDDLLNDVGDSMQRCWYRYGEGQYDFLSNLDTEGNWCMLCGTLESKNDIGNVPISSFIDWADSNDNEVMLRNGSRGKYLDYVNFKYTNITSGELQDVSNTLTSLDSQDVTEKFFVEIFEEQFQGLIDLKLKEITTQPNQKNYIVYRFDRIETDESEKIQNALLSAGASLGVSLAASTLIENAVVWGGTALICTGSLITGPGAVAICGGTVAAASLNTGKTVLKATAGVSKITKLSKLSEKLTKSITSTKTSRKANLVNSFDGSVDDAIKLADKLRKTDSDLADDYLKFANSLKDLGISDIGEIDTLIVNLQKNRKIVGDSFDRAVEADVLNNNAFRKLVARDTELIEEIEELSKVQAELIPIMKKTEDLSEPEKLKLSKYLKGTFHITAAVAAGTIAYNLDFDNRQYVDIMTQEEYYRLCGTERKIVEQ